MTSTDRGGRPAASHELEMLWDRLEGRVVDFVVGMTDPDGADHLRLELPDPDPTLPGCPPYLQFAGFGGGRMIRAELSGDAVLLPQHVLDDEGRAFLRSHGWSGNDPDGDPDARNWFVHCDLDGVGLVVAVAFAALRMHFGVPHPHLLTYDAFGPAAARVDSLGLLASEDVPHEQSGGSPVPSSPAPLVQVPTNREELLAFVGAALHAEHPGEVSLDDDGDYVLQHLGQPVWVRVRQEQLAVEILARVAHGVYSRRATAVEIGLLNRDKAWTQWTLRDRDVWQTILLPGTPFVPVHLARMLDVFLAAITETRDDLALRIGAKRG